MHVSSFIFVTLNSHPTQGCATMFFCEKSIPHNSRNPKFLTVYIGTNKCVSLNKKTVQFVLKSAKIRKIHIGLKPSLRKKTMNRFPAQKMFVNKKVGNLLVTKFLREGILSMKLGFICTNIKMHGIISLV